MHGARALKVAGYLGEEGGMTRNERVEDKEMDEAGQATEKGNGQ